jgi:hypothetical protein
MLPRHVYYFTMATTMWTFYFLVGLPSDYFRLWSFAGQLGFVVLLPTVALGVIGYLRCRGMARGKALRLAAIIAFHFTVPLFVYDWLYLGQHRGFGWAFLNIHWYLSIFYVIPWVILPPIAWLAANPRAKA